MRALLIPLVLLAPLLTGCLSDDPAALPADAPAAKSADEAGAASGASPSAPKEAFTVADPEADDARVTAYPASVRTNAAKPPVELDLSGAFGPTDCRPLNFGGFENVLRQASNHRRFHELGEHLAVGDVFQYEISLSYQNTDASWGEIHPWYAFGSTFEGHDESTAQAREAIVVNWTGQGYRASEDDVAVVAVECELGAVTTPIAYTLTVKLLFADSAIPAEAPMRVPVPEGATRMFVRGVPLDGTKGVMSHFRLFGPDDALLCECALSSGAEVATVAVEGGSELVLLVDHTDNGFVSVAFDAPPAAPLEALQAQWVRHLVLASDGGSVDQTLDLDLPRVPLFMAARVIGPDDSTPGVGRKAQITLTNGRGTPLHVAWGGHLAMQPEGSDNGMWLGMWPGDWAHDVDHHAFAPGTHVVHVSADALRGQVVVYVREYVR